MKRIYKSLLVAVAALISMNSYSQVENVGIGTKTPDNSAVLDLQSENKGLLIPRMTELSRDAISQPANGLMIYQTDVGNSGFFYFDGDSWNPLNEVNSVAAANPDNWSLQGNSIATSANAFIGTTNGTPLEFRVNNYKVGKFTHSDGNMSFGYRAHNADPSGGNNMALGTWAQGNITTGEKNSSVGNFSLRNMESGDFNTAVGYQALFTNTSGSYNTAIGPNAGYSSIGSGNVFLGRSAGYYESGDNKLYIANGSTTTPLIYGDFSAKFISVGDISVAKRDAGSAAGYGLMVKGGIMTEKVKVALSSSADWADYVFAPDYKLMPLNEVESFINENSHLPNVPSADEMYKNGVNVTETTAKLMEKIEELTLYIIELNKEVEALKANK